MPKEITHFIVADRIYQQMEDCPLKTCLTENISMYYVGAVAPDTAYYLTGSYHDFFQSLASRLHGTNGENTYDPIYRMFQSYPSTIPRPVFAFLCGVITHIMIDSSFHPLVYYLTGDYYDKNPVKRLDAVANHRRWESGLDIYMSDNFCIQDPGWLKRTLNSAVINQNQLLDCLCLLYFMDPRAYRPQVKKALTLHAVWMNTAANRPLYSVYRLAGLFSRDRLKPVLALFYPTQINREYYKQEFIYHHAGLNEQRRESIMEIEKRAVDSSLELLMMWKYLPESQEITMFLKGLRGPSLETGV